MHSYIKGDEGVLELWFTKETYLGAAMFEEEVNRRY